MKIGGGSQFEPPAFWNCPGVIAYLLFFYYWIVYCVDCSFVKPEFSWLVLIFEASIVAFWAVKTCLLFL